MVQCVHSFAPFGQVAVTALDFGPCLPPRQGDGSDAVLSLALGSEAGDISYWGVSLTMGQSTSPVGASAAPLGATADAYAHGAAVKRLAWAPRAKATGVDGRCEKGGWRIASCGEDHCVRVFRVAFNDE